MTPPVIETPMFFENGSYRLFGIVHQPVGTPSGAGWVFCHPFAEEKLWAQRVYVSFARMLAARGAWVLRFDAMGNGDSEGEFSAASVETMLSDIDCAVRLLERSSGIAQGIGLLGLRFGATLAALAAERSTKVGRLVLWEPVVDGGKYMQELLRINLTTQTAVYKEIRRNREALVRTMREGSTVNIDGYELAYPCYEQASAVNLKEGSRRFAGSCLIVQIGREGQPFHPDLKALQEAYPSSDLQGAVEEPFWKEIKRWYRTAPNLFDLTLGWMAAR
ncbi:serine aminopeptidase domain-containing protein [Nitrospira sp. NS4]|uniref:serine aminopeptidase domain-containing protein n=1 Tax=Nitrospira sp. NS4 TaxID=3414498 RepID=UPI003C3031C8